MDEHNHLIDGGSELSDRIKSLEKDVRELRRMAEYRTLFLKGMTHELRTPLTSILGFSEIMLDHENLSSSQRQICEKIQASGHQLQSILNQLVDLSRLEAGETDLLLNEFPLSETLQDCGASIARLAAKHGVKVVCMPASELPPVVSDEGKLRHALFNLMAYAISRSPGGRISLGIEMAGNSAVRIRLDSEGASLDDLPRLLNDHRQKDTIPKTLDELRPSIARRLLDIIGAKIQVERLEERRTRLILELPAVPTSH